jgi:hypothetical protein
MKMIKSFKLFESDKVDPYAKMWHMFKTIKALEYILKKIVLDHIVVQEGYRIHYEFLFIDNSSMGRNYTLLPESSVRMSENLGEFAGFRIEVSYKRDSVTRLIGGQIRLTKEQIAKIAVDTEKYSDFLREDLGDEVESVKWFSSDTGKNIVKVIL